MKIVPTWVSPISPMASRAKGETPLLHRIETDTAEEFYSDTRDRRALCGMVSSDGWFVAIPFDLRYSRCEVCCSVSDDLFQATKIARLQYPAHFENPDSGLVEQWNRLEAWKRDSCLKVAITQRKR